MKKQSHASRFNVVSRHTRLGKLAIAVALMVMVVLFKIVYSRGAERVPVVIATPAIEDIDTSVSAVGTVVPVDYFPAHASFSGVVEKVFVKLGENVRAGQMLIQLKDQYAYSRLANAEAELDSAELNRENVQMSGSQEDRMSYAADLQRARTEQTLAASALSTLRELAARGSVSESELAAGAQRLQSANTALNLLRERTTARYSKADIESWNARVKADKAAVAAEKVSYANAHVISPISGTVYELPVARYDFVPAGSGLVSVADLSRLRIRADFDEIDVPKLRPDQPVTISWDGDSSRSWHGKITETPFTVFGNEAHRMGRVTIDIDDEKGDLPVNTTVTVVAITAKRHNALTIPREALHTEGGTNYVFRIVGNRLVGTEVKVGLVNAFQAEITAGLVPADTFALHATVDRALKDNLQVKTDQ